jgi:sigma-54 dependent transcriptional regulator, acetoin dehydrogenase operon transcriptional activator AcoR
MRLNPTSQSLAPKLFFNTPAQRTALARERFFESGERPSGLVSEAVIQSWTRCLAARQSQRHAVVFDPVTRSRLQATLERNRALLVAAGDDISRLESALAGTGSRVLLTDAQGVIVHATAQAASCEEPLMKQVSRLGVDLSEAHVGTNAPAVVVKTSQAVTVHGAEHYFSRMQTLHCAAAPIRDGLGRLAGVLDLTVEVRPFAFDAAALVGVYATMIENRLLQATAGDCLVLQFQVCASMLDTPLQALVGINTRGQLAWHNATAQKLLGLAAELSQDGTHDIGALFGVTLSQLQSLTHLAGAAALRLPNGLTVCLRARWPARPQAPRATAAWPCLPGVAASPAAATGLPGTEGNAKPRATLNETTAQVIERTLAECDGNISLAARRLGVSRGLLYRRLHAKPADPIQAQA